MVDESEIAELRALVVGFLQQQLNDNPQGISVRAFEKRFPEVTDEPDDWYKRYDKRNTLEALECIQDAVKVNYNSRFNETFISLNLKSDSVDTHLVDLITHQRSSGKRRKTTSRPSSRALSSFSLNKQYSRGYDRSTRLNHGHQYRNEHLFAKKYDQPTFRSSAYRTSQTSMSMQPPPQQAFTDPRLRNSMVPPQIKPQPSSYSSSRSQHSVVSPHKPNTAQTVASLPSPQSTKPIIPTNGQKSSSQSTNSLASPRTLTTQKVPPITTVKETIQESKQEDLGDPLLIPKKDRLRQRLIHLLTYKHAEIKLFHLSALYKLEFDENLDPKAFGHKTITDLIQDPIIRDHIQIIFGSPFVTICASNRSPLLGKENVASGDSNNVKKQVTKRYSSAECLAIQKDILSSAKQKIDAADIFNVRTMLQNLEPLCDVVEPPLGNMEIEDQVKYKTIRIIYKEPNSTLKLEDWPTKFEQETRLQIRLRYYGCTSLLDFFEKLSKDTPIKVSKNKDDDYVATMHIIDLSTWIQEKMNSNCYKAITALESRYELIAYPNDSYTFFDPKEVIVKEAEYVPVHILQVKLSNYLWIQIRTPKRIENHLFIETSMGSYENYKKDGLLTVPKSFVKPGFPCAVFDQAQQRWCRALILKAPDVVDKNYEISALLVDYGVVKNYPINQLSCLMKTHLKSPVGPIYCRLHGVKNEKGIQTKKVLQEYTCPPVTLACKFINVALSNEQAYLPKYYFEVSLVDTRQNEDCNLADSCNYKEGDD